MSLKKKNSIAESVSVDLLRQVVSYDPATGLFRWLERPEDHFPEGKPSPKARCAMWNGKYAGKMAFTSADPRGYLRGAIHGRHLYAHRAAIAMATGEWPNGEVDHINRNKSDNRPHNLRVVSHAENRRNCADHDAALMMSLHKEAERVFSGKNEVSISGIRRQSKNTWSARIKRGGKETYLGTFDCFGLALLARLNAERIL